MRKERSCFAVKYGYRRVKLLRSEVCADGASYGVTLLFNIFSLSLTASESEQLHFASIASKTSLYAWRITSLLDQTSNFANMAHIARAQRAFINILRNAEYRRVGEQCLITRRGIDPYGI